MLRETPPPGTLSQLFEKHAGPRLANTPAFVGSGTAAECDGIDGLYYESLGALSRRSSGPPTVLPFWPWRPSTKTWP